MFCLNHLAITKLRSRSPKSDETFVPFHLNKVLIFVRFFPQPENYLPAHFSCSTNDELRAYKSLLSTYNCIEGLFCVRPPPKFTTIYSLQEQQKLAPSTITNPGSRHLLAQIQKLFHIKHKLKSSSIYNVP